MVSPRKGKRVRAMPPPDERVRAAVEAVVTDVARAWVLADVPLETWRFRAGTGLLLRRDLPLEVDRVLIAPDAAIQAAWSARRPRAAPATRPA